MINLDTFEAWAIWSKERKIEGFTDETELANFAILHDRTHRNEDPPPRLARWLAHLWGCSAQTINRLALVFETFGPDEITPDVPLPLYGAALETSDPSAWLARAIAEQWSPRQLRDAADIQKGKHLSSCKFEGEVEVTEWDVTTGRFAVTGLPISGDKPAGLARVTVREVLEKGE